MIPENREIFKLKLQYNGVDVFVNPVEDTVFKKPALEEKEDISSMLAYYGVLLSEYKRKLSFAKKSVELVSAQNRPLYEARLENSSRKATLDAINSEMLKDPTYTEKSLEVVNAEFNVSVLEQAIWALQTKARNISELLKTESYTK